MYQLAGFGIGFKSTMPVTQIGIRQCEGGDNLPTVGTLNFCAENGVLKSKVHGSTTEEIVVGVFRLGIAKGNAMPTPQLALSLALQNEA